MSDNLTTPQTSTASTDRSSSEQIPTTWSDERDGAFFHLVANLFRPAFLAGATVLLASYDPA